MLAKPVGNSTTEHAPITDQPEQVTTDTKPIRNGIRLPTKMQETTRQENDYDSIDEEPSREEQLYLDFMELGHYPQGPFFEQSAMTDQHKEIDILIEQLVFHGEFKALNELLHECDPLYRLNLHTYNFPIQSFCEYIRTIDATQPELRQLLFTVPVSFGLPTFFEEKAGVIVSFIQKNRQLEKFDIIGVDTTFCPEILDAIATVGNAKSILFGFQFNANDTIGDSLCQLISSCSQLQSVCLKTPHFSEKKSSEIFQALRQCRQLTDLSFSDWHFNSPETCLELQQLIQESTTLENFSCTDWFLLRGSDAASKNAPRLRMFNEGLARNTSLKTISLGYLFSWEPNGSVQSMVSALKRHPHIEHLNFPGGGDDAATRLIKLNLLAELVEHNQRIITITDLNIDSANFFTAIGFNAIHTEKECKNTLELIEDRLARNRAIASGKVAKIFCNAFFPSRGGLAGSNHIGDPGLYLAEQILRQSPDLPGFEKTMVEIALAVDETAKREHATGTTMNKVESTLTDQAE